MGRGLSDIIEKILGCCGFVYGWLWVVKIVVSVVILSICLIFVNLWFVGIVLVK